MSDDLKMQAQRSAPGAGGAAADGWSVSLATARDLPDVLGLYEHLLPEDPPLSLALAESRLDALTLIPGSGVFLLRAEGQPAATCTLVVIPNLTRGGAAYGLIENVVTHPAHRKKGYGLAVLQAAQTAAWASGCHKVMLMTASANPATHRFYANAGFDEKRTGYKMRRPDPPPG